MSKVIFIGAGPGDPELITLKGKKILEKADLVIYAGSLLNPEILKFTKPDVKLYDSAIMNREEILKIMVKAVREGKLVTRVHDGDPSIYGALQEQLDFLAKEGIECEIVPGVSSLFAAAASLKRELTLPNISQTVIITRPKGRTPVPESESIRELAKHRTTMAIFLGVQHIDSVIKEIEQGGYSKDTPVAVVYRASWREEKIVKGTLNDIVGKVKKAGIKETALILVGEVLNPKAYDYSKLYDPSFTHGYRKGDDDVP
ncbi:MAG: precorrin-4 C(11)-methyltransferase [archaeon]|nr:precorrin-4 C(11)-methyltransferase [archaeon]MCP8319423.1 precorrin-4 C(11)-methyltransferase [archaeon]